MLTLCFETGPMRKYCPTIVLHGSPDELNGISFRMMHREKQYLMPLGFRQYLDQRFLISLSLHLLQQPDSQPLFFPRDPSLRKPLPQVSLVHLAGHYRISAHRRKGTAIKDNQTTRWDMA